MPTFTELQEVVLASAFELAEAIVGGALRDDPQRGLEALRRAMSAAPEHGAQTQPEVAQNGHRRLPFRFDKSGTLPCRSTRGR